MGNLAIIDLGSNSARLSIQAAQGSYYREIHREKRDTRLAAGMGAACELQPAAMARTIEALQDFCQTAASYHPEKTLAITTAAVRLAANQAAFLAQVTAATGLTLQVLSGHDEAYYDYRGVRATLPAVTAGVILDIGGGSVEVIAYADEAEPQCASLPLGAVTMTEKFNLGAAAAEADVAGARALMTAALTDLDWLPVATTAPIILLGGANRTLLRAAGLVDLAADVAAFHGRTLAADRVQALFNHLCQLSVAERRCLAANEPKRADIMVSGLLPLVTLLQLTGAPQVVFSESGVRDGLLQEQLGK